MSYLMAFPEMADGKLGWKSKVLYDPEVEMEKNRTYLHNVDKNEQGSNSDKQLKLTFRHRISTEMTRLLDYYISIFPFPYHPTQSHQYAPLFPLRAPSSCLHLGPLIPLPQRRWISSDS